MSGVEFVLAEIVELAGLMESEAWQRSLLDARMASVTSNMLCVVWHLTSC